MDQHIHTSSLAVRHISFLQLSNSLHSSILKPYKFSLKVFNFYHSLTQYSM